LDEATERQTSSSRVATAAGPKPLASSMAADGRRDRWDLADVDHLALPLFDVTLLTFVKLIVDVPLPGATYDTVPPPPLSTDPGMSLIAAGPAKE
jgi:hypothetical protein